MLRGDHLHLRTVRRADLPELHAGMSALEHRGAYFPLGLQGEPVLERRFEEDGFWSDDAGMLLMIGADDAIVGEIEFFPIADYLTGYELSYLVFGPEHRGRGYATEAVSLLTAYLFARRRIERVQLNIHPDNAASRRVAEKTGFTHEGVLRRCWFNRGEFHDLEIWSMLRSELPTPLAPDRS